MRVGAAAALLACVLALPVGATAPPPLEDPSELVVGVSMPVTGLQVGAVRGRSVVLAKGLEIDLARALAKRLGVPRVRFVHEPLFSTLVSGRPADWDLALAAITITPERARRVDFSKPYLTADQAVLMHEGFTPVPTSIAALRGLQLCSERATTGARAIVDRIKPTRKPRLVANPSQLTYDLYSDRCDAIVFRRARPRGGARGGSRTVRAVRGPGSSRASTTASPSRRAARSARA